MTADELVAFRVGRSGRTTIEELNQVLTSFLVFEQLQAANQTLTDVFAFTYAARCDSQMTSKGECPEMETLWPTAAGSCQFSVCIRKLLHCTGHLCVR